MSWKSLEGKSELALRQTGRKSVQKTKKKKETFVNVCKIFGQNRQQLCEAHSLIREPTESALLHLWGLTGAEREEAVTAQFGG